jgi:hypothetical protein
MSRCTFFLTFSSSFSFTIVQHFFFFFQLLYTYLQCGIVPVCYIFIYLFIYLHFYSHDIRISFLRILIQFELISSALVHNVHEGANRWSHNWIKKKFFFFFGTINLVTEKKKYYNKRFSPISVHDHVLRAHYAAC